MPIMAKSNDEYAEVKAIKTPDGTEIDYVLSKVDNTYKRTYTAIRELEDAPPLNFKSIKPNANLIDYRIYGQTSRNLFDENWLDNSIWSNGTWYFDNHILKYTTTEDSRAWVYNSAQFKFTLKAGTYTISTLTVKAPEHNQIYAGWIVFDSGGQILVAAQGNYFISKNINIRTFTLNEKTNIGFCFKTMDGEYQIMLSSGSTPLPYEPYGESVGDRTANLFDINSPNVQKKCYYDATGQKQNSTYHDISDFIPCGANNSYTLSFCVANGYFMNYGIFVNLWDNQKNFVSNLAAEAVIYPNDINKTMQYNITPLQDGYITFNYLYDVGYMTNIMLVEGSTPLPYEPYGYKVPVTVSNGTDTLTTPIYLPEQIKKVGDEAEYIDYGEQKFHRISGADLDVTLPAQPTVTGTNVLSVGTEVQPSSIYLKGAIKALPSGGDT